MEGILYRIGRKNMAVKTYYYKLYGRFLVYFLKENDEEYKGYLKITKDVLLERK
jgi:hypothetical protein